MREGRKDLPAIERRGRPETRAAQSQWAAQCFSRRQSWSTGSYDRGVVRAGERAVQGRRGIGQGDVAGGDTVLKVEMHEMPPATITGAPALLPSSQDSANPLDQTTLRNRVKEGARISIR